MARYTLRRNFKRKERGESNALKQHALQLIQHFVGVKLFHDFSVFSRREEGL